MQYWDIFLYAGIPSVKGSLYINSVYRGGNNVLLKEFLREIERMSSAEPFHCILGFLCCFSKVLGMRFPSLDCEFLSKTVFACVGEYLARLFWKGLECRSN